MPRQATKAPAPRERSPRETHAALGALVGKWQAEADNRVARRSHVEEEWLCDLQQLHGVYDEATKQRLEASKGSKLFQNSTRPKTIAGAARMTDILFPTDERNWEILPTPVPELALQGALADQAKAQAQAQGDEAGAQAAQGALDQIAQVNQAAKETAERMLREMEDQLEECHYAEQARDAIMDLWKLGVAIIEGPVTNDRTRRNWGQSSQQGPDGETSKSWELKQNGDPKPAFYHVDPWAFFPDPDALRGEDSESNLVRYLWNDKQLRKFARLPEVDLDAVRELLREKPRGNAPSYVARLRGISGETDLSKDIFQVWKYVGPIAGDDMKLLAEAAGDTATMRDMEEVDPLEEVQCIAWFCQGRVLKWAIYPLDSGECMFSVSNLMKDDGSIWGYGIARMMRDPQRAKNAAWRMLMDNAGLATGDQIVIDRRKVEPVDGVWAMTPRKLWNYLGEGDWRTAFGNFAINSHIEELIALIHLADEFIDDTTNIPVVAQGDVEGVRPNTTAFATAVLTNSMNVIFKLSIRAWDDDQTVPNLRRLYDWNMQFSQKDWIKGDFEVVARGASVLMMREMQAQTTLALATSLGSHPTFGPYIKGLPLVRQIFRAHQLDPDELVVTDDEGAEIDKQLMEAASAQQGGPAGKPQAELDLLQDEIDAKVAIAEADRESRREVAQITRETRMMELAETLNMTADELAAKLDIKDREIRAKERSIAAEIAVRGRETAPQNQTQIANS